MSTKNIILASGSPRRREILENVGLKFAVVTSEFVEDNTINIPPAELVKQLALGKAQWVAKSHPGTIVIGVDTLMSFEGMIMGKLTPRSPVLRFWMVIR